MSLPDEDVPFDPPEDYCLFEACPTGYETREDCNCSKCKDFFHKPYDRNEDWIPWS